MKEKVEMPFQKKLAVLLIFLFLMPTSVGAAPLKRTHKKNSAGHSKKETVVPEPKPTEWEARSNHSEKWFFHDLPRHIGGDIKTTFWNPWHIGFLAAGAALVGGVHQADNSVQNSVQNQRFFSSKFDKGMALAFHPFVLEGAALLAVGFSDLAHAPKAVLTSGTMLEALTITEVLTLGLQFATYRQRPDGSNFRSFPSGHTSGAFSLAAVTEVYYGPKFGIPAFVLASVIGASRVDGNHHHVSDVVAGAVLGTLIGIGTAEWHKKEFSKYFVTPTFDRKLAGITVGREF